MNETERQVKLLELMLDAYVKLSMHNASPGDKSASLYMRIQWLEKRMRELLK